MMPYGIIPAPQSSHSVRLPEAELEKLSFQKQGCKKVTVDSFVGVS